jgi:hypothetical protein
MRKYEEKKEGARGIREGRIKGRNTKEGRK